MTEKEKMVSGLIYDTSDKQLCEEKARAQSLCEQYNNLLATDVDARQAILDELIPDRDKSATIIGPFWCDYGTQITLGKNFFANFNFTVLDVCPVVIGDNVMIGPNCSIVPPCHPFKAEQRIVHFKDDGTPFTLEYGKPVTIKSNCWIASNVTICGGVTIGENCIIGAGSVVTRDVPDNSLAFGNPCRVSREITDDDLMDLKF